MVIFSLGILLFVQWRIASKTDTYHNHLVFWPGWTKKEAAMERLRRWAIIGDKRQTMTVARPAAAALSWSPTKLWR